MGTIKRSMLASEYHNTYINRAFEQIDELPHLNVSYTDDGEYAKIYTDCMEYSDSDFCGQDRPYDYGYFRYYRLTYTDGYLNEEGKFEEDSTDNYEYVVVFEEYNDAENTNEKE